jgi:hypothetical protein
MRFAFVLLLFLSGARQAQPPAPAREWAINIAHGLDELGGAPRRSRCSKRGHAWATAWGFCSRDRSALGRLPAHAAAVRTGPSAANGWCSLACCGDSGPWRPTQPVNAPVVEHSPKEADSVKGKPPLLIVLCVSVGNAQAVAGTRAGHRPLLGASEELPRARSAAPAIVSDSADLYTLSDTGYVLAVRGTSGNASLVDRSWPQALEPTCFDPEARATIIQRTLLQMRAVQRGRSGADVDRELTQALDQGRWRFSSRPALAYMMSAGQRLISDDGKPAGRWRPHLMLYMPYASNTQLGMGPNGAGELLSVVDSGKPLANLTIVVPQFIDFAQ